MMASNDSYMKKQVRYMNTVQKENKYIPEGAKRFALSIDRVSTYFTLENQGSV